MDKGENLKKMLKEAGFTQIKLWEQASNHLRGDGENFIGKGFGGK